MELLSSQRISKDYALYQSSLEDTEWSRIIRQTGMPPAAFSSEARKRRRETASKMPASAVTNDMILHGTHLRSPVKEDVRGPTRWALDVRKLQHERKQRQFDMKGIIPLPRACIIKQQNHQINTKNGRRSADRLDPLIDRLLVPQSAFEKAENRTPRSETQVAF